MLILMTLSMVMASLVIVFVKKKSGITASFRPVHQPGDGNLRGNDFYCKKRWDFGRYSPFSLFLPKNIQ